MTRYDTIHDVTWLADFDLPASNQFGLPLCDNSHAEPCVNASGSMDWDSAEAWLDAMNAAHYGNGFEGTDLVGNTLYVTAYFPGQRDDVRPVR